MNAPMPVSLDVTIQFKVTDSNGRILRFEELRPGTNLRVRLRLAHRNYQLQGWSVDPLLPGCWSFCAAKTGRRILIGIQRPRLPFALPTTAVTDPLTQPRQSPQDIG
jgi:hypothetical protein